MAKSKKKPGAAPTSQKPATTPPVITPTTSKLPPQSTRTKERREERKQAERRRRNAVTVIGVLVFVAFLAGIYLIVNLPQDAPIPPDTLTRYENIPQGYSANGMPVLGDPFAPVQVVSYTSFACPACKDFHNAMSDVIIRRVREGVIAYIIAPQENGDIPNGNGAARASLCAAEQGKFFEYADMLFSWQELFGNQAFSQNRLFSGAEALG